MTVASASTEARVSYQLFQAQACAGLYLSGRPPAIKCALSRGRAFAHRDNATFRRARFDRAATCPMPGARISSERRFRSPYTEIARGYVEDVGRL